MLYCAPLYLSAIFIRIRKRCGLWVCIFFSTTLQTFSNTQYPIPTSPPTIEVYVNDFIKEKRLINTAYLELLKSGVDSVIHGNILQALYLRNNLQASTLEYDLLTWLLVLMGSSDVKFEEFEFARNRLSDWPGISLIAKYQELALCREKKSDDFIKYYFEKNPLLTASGALLLAKTLIGNGEFDSARKKIIPWWHKATLNYQEEKLMFETCGVLLTQKEALQRLTYLLYMHQLDSAKLFVSTAQAKSLFDAFLAVISRDPQAANAINNVQKIWLKDPIFTFLNIQFLRYQGDFLKASNLLIKNLQNRKKPLISPESWAKEQILLSRELFEAKQYSLGYKLVTFHHGESSDLKIKLDFLAGWYTLRFLHLPQKALHHFHDVLTTATLPISKSRAYYWLGRTEEALKHPNQALAWFAKAASYSMCFYGQLAAQQLSDVPFKDDNLPPSFQDISRLKNIKLIKAIKLLEQIECHKIAIPLYLHLASTFKKNYEFFFLAKLAETTSDFATILQIGKLALARGLLSTKSLAYPVSFIPDSFKSTPHNLALLYAISRQESAFQSAALSSAGAAGFLQLLPTTAKQIASELGIPFSYNRLLNDVAYNTSLGSAYLNKLLAHFNGSYILAIAAYNAGARRVDQWIVKFGDPRNKPLYQIIDWTESIPYTETRNYVHRVLENYEVYKEYFSGKMTLREDLKFSQ